MTAFWRRSRVPSHSSPSVHEASLLPTRRQMLLEAATRAFLRGKPRGNKVCQHRKDAEHVAAQMAIRMAEQRYWTRFKDPTGSGLHLRFSAKQGACPARPVRMHRKHLPVPYRRTAGRRLRLPPPDSGLRRLERRHPRSDRAPDAPRSGACSGATGRRRVELCCETAYPEDRGDC